MSKLDIDNLLGMYGEEEPNGSGPQHDDDAISEGTNEEYDVGDDDGVYDDHPEAETPPESVEDGPEEDEEEYDEENGTEENEQEEEEEENDEQSQEEDNQEGDQDDESASRRDEDDHGDGSESRQSDEHTSRREDDETNDDDNEEEAEEEEEEDSQSVASSSRRSTNRTDALFEHANWKERKLEEKREFEAGKHTFKPQTNTKQYRNSSSVSSASRLSAHERLYAHGQRKREASLTAKRREIDEREMFGTFSKSTYNKPGHDKLASRVPPKMAWDTDRNQGSQDNGGGDRTWGDVLDASFETNQGQGVDDQTSSTRSSPNSVQRPQLNNQGQRPLQKLWDPDRSRPRSASNNNNAQGNNRSSSARSQSASSTRSSTRRTDALYLESILRQQRREAKIRDLEDEHSFQPDLSRGRSLYREPYEKINVHNGSQSGSRAGSVHDRLYEDGSRKREFTQDVVAKVYSRSRVARNRRMVEYSMGNHGDGDGGPQLDHNGDFLDEFDEKFETRSDGGGGGGSSHYSGGGGSRRSASTATHTQRTDALYLEATLRRARKDEKAAQESPENTFSPATNSNGALPRYNDKLGSSSSSANGSQRRSASVNNVGGYNPTGAQYRSLSDRSGVSRHDLLYLDGERKRQRNIDARFDPHQKGTGELVGMYNTKWHSSARLKKFNPLLLTKQEDQLNRRFSGGGDGRRGSGRHSGDHNESRSLDGFSVGTDLTSNSMRSHTRRTEALYLEASLRAARKEAMREAHADHGFTFQPQVKTAGLWSGQAKSLNHVVSRLYNPQAAAEEKAEKAAKKKAFELKDFVGNPTIKVVQGKSRSLTLDPFERLHIHATAKAQAIKDKAQALLLTEKKYTTFSPLLEAKTSSAARSRSASRTRKDDWAPKTGAKGTNPALPFSSSPASSFAPYSYKSSVASSPTSSSSPLSGNSTVTTTTAAVAPSASTSAAAAAASSSSRRSSAPARFDVKTGRHLDENPPPPPEPAPLSALERFRLRQAERAKKRDELEQAAIAATEAEVQYEKANRYSSSPTRKSTSQSSNPASPMSSAGATNPLFSGEIESY